MRFGRVRSYGAPMGALAGGGVGGGGAAVVAADPVALSAAAAAAEAAAAMLDGLADLAPLDGDVAGDDGVAGDYAALSSGWAGRRAALADDVAVLAAYAAAAAQAFDAADGTIITVPVPGP